VSSQFEYRDPVDRARGTQLGTIWQPLSGLLGPLRTDGRATTPTIQSDEVAFHCIVDRKISGSARQFRKVGGFVNRDEQNESWRNESAAAYEAEYRDALETSRTIDSKAQVALTVSGVFLAAVFAFSRDLSAFGCVDRGLLLLPVLALVIALFFGVTTYRVQTTIAAPMGTFVGGRIKDLIAVSEEKRRAETRVRFVDEKIDTWSRAIAGLSTVNVEKAKSLTRLHFWLIVAAVLTAVFCISRILGIGGWLSGAMC